jgi:hypothetical protein
MPKLTDTQTIILSRAATRPGNLAMPLPVGLHGAAAKMAVTRMITNGWIEEVDADSRKGEPLWRETGDGHGTTLTATEAGLEAIGIEPVVAKATSASRRVTLQPDAEPAVTEAPKPVIIALLQRPEGASIAEITEATDWLAHSVRGLISGGLKKKLGLPVTSDKVEGRGTIYKLPA